MVTSVTTSVYLYHYRGMLLDCVTWFPCNAFVSVVSNKFLYKCMLYNGYELDLNTSCTGLNTLKMCDFKFRSILNPPSSERTHGHINYVTMTMIVREILMNNEQIYYSYEKQFSHCSKTSSCY